MNDAEAKANEGRGPRHVDPLIKEAIEGAEYITFCTCISLCTSVAQKGPQYVEGARECARALTASYKDILAARETRGRGMPGVIIVVAEELPEA